MVNMGTEGSFFDPSVPIKTPLKHTFFNQKAALFLLLLSLMNVGVILHDAELSAASVLKVLLWSLFPFASAYIMKRYYFSALR
jgi:hypothetical protein